ncbi:type VI secretion protein [Streptomyces sp. RFCAC02]|uniref:type VI secretion protein n=1 Tax=Streptomyces sp. RFCAC02 TaxID=2499143 RepID=UPI00101F6B0D|nr:type VI secretion protein [Streptomyces sp. RFCAC02]
MTEAPRAARGGVPDALLIGGLALMLALTALIWTATGLAGLVTGGAWPSGVTFFSTAGAVRSFLTAPGDVPAAWPEAAPEDLPGAAAVWGAFLVQVILVFCTALALYVRIARWRARRGAPRPQPVDRSRPADRAQPVEQSWEAEQVPAAVPEPEPLAAPAVPVPVPVPAREDHATAVLTAPPGLVVVDPDGSLWTRTGRRRTKSGPVHVYDPGHATDSTVRLRWSPLRGCEDMPVARRRATALLDPVRPVEPVFTLDASTAETLLRCYLHAAALAGQPLQQVHRWALGRSAGEPAKILRTHPRAAGGAVMELESALTGHPVRRDAALDLVARALTGLEQVHIRQACSPGRVDVLALDNLAGEGGTLYIAGAHRETAPLRHALVAELSVAWPGLTVIGGPV